MKPIYLKTKVLENNKICDGIYKLTIKDNRDIKSGQFYMIKPKNAFLGRPISVCEVKDGCVNFLYAVVGKGTEDFMNLKPQNEIEVMGPLGNGFEEKKYGKIALVAGGIGIAPMVQLAKKLKEAGNELIDLYVGFRDESYLIEEFLDYVDNVNITSNTGKVGIKGFITEILEPSKYDTVLCCGPEVMMEKVVEMCKKAKVNIYVSMEKHMACGVGACLVCTCKSKSGNKRTCKDGPVFNGYEIEF